MDRTRYQAYLDCFNARDYAGVLAFYASDFEVVFAGIALRGREELLRFYRFFHAHVREHIELDRYTADAHTVALEVRVRLEAIAELTPQALAAAGYGQLLPLAKGQVVEIPQFIHYHLAGGRFTRALCALYQPPA